MAVFKNYYVYFNIFGHNMILLRDSMRTIWINYSVLLKTDLRTASYFWSAPIRLSKGAVTPFYSRFSTSCNQRFCKGKNIKMLGFVAFPAILFQISQFIFLYSANKDKTLFFAHQAVFFIQMNNHWYRFLVRFFFHHIYLPLFLILGEYPKKWWNGQKSFIIHITEIQNLASGSIKQTPMKRFTFVILILDLVLFWGIIFMYIWWFSINQHKLHKENVGNWNCRNQAHLM